MACPEPVITAHAIQGKKFLPIAQRSKDLANQLMLLTLKPIERKLDIHECPATGRKIRRERILYTFTPNA
jgi:hypothetical protein